MMRHWTALAALVCALPAQAVEPATSPLLDSPADVDRLVTGYYLSPQPDAVGPLLTYLDESGMLEARADARAPLIGFVAEVVAQNPDRVEEWEALASEFDLPTREVLVRGLQLGRAPERLSELDRSPATNDILWGAYFASGKEDYLLALIERALWAAGQKDVALFLTGASAAWSLSSNARQHEAVRLFLEQERDGSIGLRREMLNDVLTLEPADFQRNMRQVLERRRRGR